MDGSTLTPTDHHHASHENRRQTDTRLARVEAEIESLGRGMRDLTNIVRDLASAFHGSQRTQWGPLLTAVSVVLVIGGLMFTFYARDQSRFDRTVTMVFEHVRDGHPMWVAERVENVSDRVDHVAAKFDEQERWAHQHMAEDARHEGSTDERLRALERAVFP